MHEIIPNLEVVRSAGINQNMYKDIKINNRSRIDRYEI